MRRHSPTYFGALPQRTSVNIFPSPRSGPCRHWTPSPRYWKPVTQGCMTDKITGGLPSKRSPSYLSGQPTLLLSYFSFSLGEFSPSRKFRVGRWEVIRGLSDQRCPMIPPPGGGGGLPRLSVPLNPAATFSAKPWEITNKTRPLVFERKSIHTSSPFFSFFKELSPTEKTSGGAEGMG